MQPSGPQEKERGTSAPNRAVDGSCVQMRQVTFEAPLRTTRGPVLLCLNNIEAHLSVGGSPLLFILLEGTQDFRDDAGILQGSGVP